jgi:MFS family permease
MKFKPSYPWYRALYKNFYWFSFTLQSQVLTVLLLPVLIDQFQPEQRGSLLGIARLAAILAAVIAQALAVGLSESFNAGRNPRRTVFLAGNILQILLLGGASYADWSNQPVPLGWILAGYVLLNSAAAFAHSAIQNAALSPADGTQRAFFAASKALLELPLPLLCLALVFGDLLALDRIFPSLVILMLILIAGTICGTAALSATQDTRPSITNFSWQPFVKLTGLTGLAVLIILLSGIVLQFAPAASAGVYLAMICALILTSGVLSTAIVFRSAFSAELRPSLPLRAWLTNRMIFFAASANVVTFLMFDLRDRLGFPSTPAAAPAAGWALLVMGVFLMLTTLPANWLIRQFGKKKLIAAATIMAAAGMSLWLRSGTLAEIYLAIGLAGGGIGLFYAASWATGMEIIPSEQIPPLLNNLNLLGAASAAAGVYLSGLAVNRLGNEAPLVIFIALMLLSLASIPWMRKKQPAR